MKTELTILHNDRLDQMSKECAIYYCQENKDKILQNGKTEEDFNKIINDLKTYYLYADGLPELGIHDQALGITHPTDLKSDTFTKAQLEKLNRGLHMKWGKFPYSNENCYMTSACTPDSDFEDLISKGLCTKFEWDRHSRIGTTREQRVSRGQTNDVVAYFLTEEGLVELRKVWTNIRCSWSKVK